MTTSRTMAWSLGWPAGTVPTDYVLGGVRAVLPGAIIDNARIVVRDGLIAEVGAAPAGSAADLDGRGLLCVPGLIDVHSDALEQERAPRPGVLLPWDFAVMSLEGKLSAAGITTAFHGASFQEKIFGAVARTAAAAVDVCAAVSARSSASAPLVGHRILYRLDARSPDGATALAAALDAHPAAAESLPLVSHEDHTPGQGQYADRRYYERYVAAADGLSASAAVARVDELIPDRDGRAERDARRVALGQRVRGGARRTWPGGRAGVGLPAVRAARRGLYAGAGRTRDPAGGDGPGDVGRGRRRGPVRPGPPGDGPARRPGTRRRRGLVADGPRHLPGRLI